MVSVELHGRTAAASRRGADAGYRIRVCDYRILYLVGDAVLGVFVVEEGHRQDVYE